MPTFEMVRVFTYLTVVALHVGGFLCMAGGFIGWFYVEIIDKNKPLVDPSEKYFVMILGGLAMYVLSAMFLYSDSSSFSRL